MGKTKNFIVKARIVHMDKYDYLSAKYIGAMIKLIITCRLHGDFMQSPNNHLRGKGCPKCVNNNLRVKFAFTREKFIEEARSVHGDRYDYSLVEYINQHTRVKIICPIHGVFEQLPLNHLKGANCIRCRGAESAKKYKFSNEEFANKSNKIHRNLYDYSKVDYINNSTPVTIICKEHGEFSQIPYHHMSGARCPNCRRSRGESIIEDYLRALKIQFEIEKTFIDCRGNKKPLPFDFYLPEYNVLIEFDGKQHYEPIDYYGGMDGFEKRRRYDEIKNKWSADNGINLLRIRYDEYILIPLMKFLDPYLNPEFY
ncbi:SPbeta prophage-derived protein [Pacmanvirus S19]|nr:SPbeta prophage-derived protein [Pacmanvirus S19]